MPLATGSRLGPYEIVAPIGAGGMGEVYRARDTRLGRPVALKVISSLLAGAPELRSRFEREARAISQLSHPNICTLYDVGQDGGIDYLVLEYLEGESLDRRLAAGPLALESALEVAIQIGDALAAAHERGIVHRDLKPANVVLTRSGAKLLDFGLARLLPPPMIARGSGAPTISAPLTSQGTLLGTFQYMSPEQLEGADADERSDIWAYGCVIYEMVVGRRAFNGSSQASLIGAIIKDEPPSIAATYPIVSPLLEDVIRRCIRKNPDDRWQSARDIVALLRWIQAAPKEVPSKVSRSRASRRELLAWVAAGITAIISAVMGARSLSTRSPAASPVRFAIEPPPQMAFAPLDGAAAPFPAISPDGRSIVFMAERQGENQNLYIRTLDSLDVRALPGTQGGSEPFWSPDSRYVGFFAGAKLKIIDVNGGLPQTLCDAPSPDGGTWNVDGTILFSPDALKGVYRIAASGGAPSVVLAGNEQSQSLYVWPRFLPDGHHFLLLHESAIYLASIDGGAPQRLVNADSRAEYAPPGVLLFARNSTLMAQRFNPGRGEVIGEPVPIVEAIRVGVNGRSAFSVANDGTIVYRQGQAPIYIPRQLTWYDRSGHQLALAGPPGIYETVVLSPDGRRVAVDRLDDRNMDVWIIDLQTSASTRLTFDPGTDTHPLWSPDGRYIFFASWRKTAPGLYRIPGSGAGREELLLPFKDTLRPHTATRDMKTILFTSGGLPPTATPDDAPISPKGSTIWMASMGPPASAKRLIGDATFSQLEERLSPDNRLLAYVSNESGRQEVYVTTFPDHDERWTITTMGGASPLWSRDGHELFFLTQGSVDLLLNSVEVRREQQQVRFGSPTPLFEIPVRLLGDPYDVAPDGRFLVARLTKPRTLWDPLIVLQHWQDAVPGLH
jgi:serine/threonine protein kinase